MRLMLIGIGIYFSFVSFVFSQDIITEETIRKLKEGHDEVLQNFGYRSIPSEDSFEVVSNKFVSVRYGNKEAAIFYISNNNKEKIFAHVAGVFSSFEDDYKEVRFLLTIKITQENVTHSVQFNVTYKSKVSYVSAQFVINKEGTDFGKNWLNCFSCIQKNINVGDMVDIANQCKSDLDCWIKHAGKIGIKLGLNCITTCITKD